MRLAISFGRANLKKARRKRRWGPAQIEKAVKIIFFAFYQITWKNSTFLPKNMFSAFPKHLQNGRFGKNNFIRSLAEKQHFLT